MPEICRFEGISIKMFAREHNPPHFHAYQGKYKAVFNISTGELIEGDFPANKRVLVEAWALLRKKELMRNWKSLTKGVGFDKIEPLR